MKYKINFRLVLFLFLALSVTFLFLKCNSTETIPYEDPIKFKILNETILKNKSEIEAGILSLQNLHDLPEYTDYKKNYVLARLYEKKKDYKNSIFIYEKLLNKNYPLKERVFFHLANLYALQGDDKIALKYFNKLLKEFSGSRSVPQAKYYLAQAYLRLHLYKEASYTLQSLKTEFPNSQFGIAANYYIGENAYQKNEFQYALNYWREYLRLSPDGRFASEIAAFFKTKSSLPLKPFDFTLLGDVFYHKKDYKSAADYYKLESNPLRYYELGYSLFRLNNKNESYKYLKQFAYKYPKSKNTKWALFYASRTLAFPLRKLFWAEITKDIPSLAYYSTYKEALLESNSYKREKILKEFLFKYPNNEFYLDAVWEILWQKIKDKSYAEALEIGEKYFNLTKQSIFARSETRAKIGFWIGKVAEKKNDINKAIDYYKETGELLYDSYYSHRAKDRYLALSGKEDKHWDEQNRFYDFTSTTWSIPIIIKKETIKKYFGSTVFELIGIHELDEAIELIGKSKFPSKRITSWLRALNNEYESSINLASSLVLHYHIPRVNLLWELAYPLHFWENVIGSCKDYPTLDPLLVCSVIRQESRFDKQAKSISGAYGLMQLIFPTAKTVSRQIGLTINSPDDLFDPKINISLGVNYLNGLIVDLNNPLFAVASYNAGPRAVKNWVSEFKGKNKDYDLDYFVEEIPYDETRNYVKRVFASYWVYIGLYKN